MKKITLCFFLAVLHTAGALAAGDVVISRAIPVKTSDESVTQERTDKTVLNRAGRRVNIANNTNNTESKSVITRGTTRTNAKVTENISRTKTNTGVASRSVNTKKSVSARHSAEEGANIFGR